MQRRPQPHGGTTRQGEKPTALAINTLKAQAAVATELAPSGVSVTKRANGVRVLGGVAVRATPKLRTRSGAGHGPSPRDDDEGLLTSQRPRRGPTSARQATGKGLSRLQHSSPRP